MSSEHDVQSARYSDPQVPNYNLHSIAELLPEILDKGKRNRGGTGKHRKSLRPTNSERMNRALKELGTSAFKIHMLLWQWRGAPAKGNLPFFTIHSLGKFCSLTRPTVRAGVKELIRKGWICKQGYNIHHKNELYRLIPIRDVCEVDGGRSPLAPPGNPPEKGGRSLVTDVIQPTM